MTLFPYTTLFRSDAAAGAAFDDDLVAVMHQLAHAAGHQPDPALKALHLFRHADQHRQSFPGPARQASGLHDLRNCKRRRNKLTRN